MPACQRGPATRDRAVPDAIGRHDHTDAAWLFRLLLRKHQLLALRGWRFGDWLASCRRISTFAIPGILSMILMPLSATVITRLLSGFGHEAVAAAGVAGRIEMFAFVTPMALGISLIPLSCLGAYLWGINGVFWGRLVTDLLVGSLGLVWVARTSRAVLAAEAPPSR